jgi:hypothetical protein
VQSVKDDNRASDARDAHGLNRLGIKRKLPAALGRRDIQPPARNRFDSIALGKGTTEQKKENHRRAKRPHAAMGARHNCRRLSDL